VNRQRIETWVAWTLAVILPGGLALLALWLSVKAAKRRAALRTSAVRISQVGRLSQPVRLSQPSPLPAAPSCCPAE
jgi:hypothetical protein